jgi:dTDP-4-amino-4,6-dideoxygalactose transaminase
VLDGGSFGLGEEVEAFERVFARYCGTDHAIGVASGTDAITVALKALGVGPGDEVVTAANTCVPTVAGIAASGAEVVLVDPNPETYTLDADALARVIGPRTRAVVPVHLYGRCADMEQIAAVARASGLKVVEDAAHAHGATYGDRRAGALGEAAAFSFYPTKNLGALGDGGAVVTSDAYVAERARALREPGIHAEATIDMNGPHSRLDALQAAILRLRLDRLDERNARRGAIAAHYRDALEDAPLLLPQEVPARGHVHHLFVVRVADRDRFRDALASEGIPTSVHYARPIHHHDAYATLRRDGALNVSERLAAQVVSLPLQPAMSDAEIEAVVSATRAALRRAEAPA